MTYEEIILMIKEELKKRGISQRAFAEYTGYSHGTLSNWLTFINPAPWMAIENMLMALGMSMEVKIRRDDDGCKGID